MNKRTFFRRKAMITTKVRFAILAGLLMLGTASFADTVYNYGPGGLSISGSGDFYQAKGGYDPHCYTLSATDDTIKLENTGWNEGAPNWLAWVWNAPEGQSLTSVTFSWTCSGWYQFPAVFAEKTPITSTTYDGDFDPSYGSSTALGEFMGLSYWWANTQTSGTTTVYFDGAGGFNSVGIGLFDETSAVGHYVEFSNISITTVPEPATVALISLGSLSLLRRYRRNR